MKQFRIKETNGVFIPQVKDKKWKILYFNHTVNKLVPSNGSNEWAILYHSKKTYNEAIEVINSYKEQEKETYIKYHYI